MAITTGFQPVDRGSIPLTRSIELSSTLRSEIQSSALPEAQRDDLDNKNQPRTGLIFVCQTH